MIKIENLHIQLGSFKLENINLEVAEKEYFILLGPTAAGKTVLLESLAGLNPVRQGRIFIDDQEITDLPPEKRGISLVYQYHALFPHLSVKNNILYGLRIRRTADNEIKKTLDWLSELLGIAYLLDRRPLSLSGGERQKVALARALSVKPRILLLDEPLSALDPRTREQVRQELKSIHRSLQSTVIQVTHDFEEAMSLGSRIAVLGEGRIQQTGSTEEIFRSPQSRFVAEFTLMTNIYKGEVIKQGQACRFMSSFQNIGGMTKNVSNTGHAGDPVIFSSHRGEASGGGVENLEIAPTDLEGDCWAAIRPEDVQIFKADVPSGTPNILEGYVSEILDKGASLTVKIRSKIDVQGLITRRQYRDLDLKTGDRVSVSLDPSSICVFRE